MTTRTTLRRIWLDLVGGSLHVLALSLAWLLAATLWPALPAAKYPSAALPAEPAAPYYESAVITATGELLVARRYPAKTKRPNAYRTVEGVAVAQPVLTRRVGFVEPDAEPVWVEPLTPDQSRGERWFLVATPDRQRCGLVAYGTKDTPAARRRLAWFDRRGFARTPPRRADWLPRRTQRPGQPDSPLVLDTLDETEGPHGELTAWLLQGDTAQELLLGRRALGERLTLPGARQLGANHVDWSRPGDPQAAREVAVVLRSETALLVHRAGLDADRRFSLPAELRQRTFSVAPQPDGNLTVCCYPDLDEPVRTWQVFTLTPAGTVVRRQSVSLPRLPSRRPTPQPVQVIRPLLATCPVLLACDAIAGGLGQSAEQDWDGPTPRQRLRTVVALIWPAWLVCSLLLALHIVVTEQRRGRRQWHWALLAGWGVPGWLVWRAHAPRPAAGGRGVAGCSAAAAEALRPSVLAPWRALLAKELAAMAWPALLLVLAGLALGTWGGVIRPARDAWSRPGGYHGDPTARLAEVSNLLMLCAAVLLATSQTVGEARAGTWHWLLTRPVPRWRLAAAKLLSGIGLTLLVGAVPLAAADLWCRVPGHLPGPYYPGQLAPSWLALTTAPLVYCAAVVAGARYRRVLSLWPLALLSGLLLPQLIPGDDGYTPATALVCAVATLVAVWVAGHAITTLDVE